MNHGKFAIGRFENRNGRTSWRVEGQIDGTRFRRNFKTKEEAVAEKAIPDLKYLQLSANIRSATTFVTDTERRGLEGGNGLSRSFLSKWQRGIDSLISTQSTASWSL
jgi:hypothetical protein